MRRALHRWHPVHPSLHAQLHACDALQRFAACTCVSKALGSRGAEPWTVSWRAGDSTCVAPAALDYLKVGEETRQYFCEDQARDTRVALGSCGQHPLIEARECNLAECIVKAGVESFVADADWEACSSPCTDTLIGLVPMQSRCAHHLSLGCRPVLHGAGGHAHSLKRCAGAQAARSPRA